MLDFIASPLFVQISVFLGVSTLLVGIYWLMSSGDSRLDHRFESLGDNNRPSPEDRYKPRPRGMMQLLIPQLPRLAKVILPNDEATRTRLQAQLIQAGIYSSSAMGIYLTAKLVLMTLAPIIGLLAAWMQWIDSAYALLLGGLFGCVGMLIPSMWLSYYRLRRQRELRTGLADFLDLMVACLEGGVGMQAAISQVADELRAPHPILASELLVVLREVEVGRSIEVALAHLAERTGLEELRSLATFVQQAQRFGSTMADALRELSDMLRSQRETRAEERAQKASVKILIPTLLFIFPTVFVVLAGPAAIQIQESLGKTGGGGVVSEDQKK